MYFTKEGKKYDTRDLQNQETQVMIQKGTLEIPGYICVATCLEWNQTEGSRRFLQKRKIDRIPNILKHICTIRKS